MPGVGVYVRSLSVQVVAQKSLNLSSTTIAKPACRFFSSLQLWALKGVRFRSPSLNMISRGSSIKLLIWSASTSPVSWG
jgi:hypothetical protein